MPHIFNLLSLRNIHLNKATPWIFVLLTGLSTMASAATLATAVVSDSQQAQMIAVEGVVEAVKSSVIAAQVAGSITQLTVKVGDKVRAGQLLARIDARLAGQQLSTSQAQVAAAQAQLAAASEEYARKQRLYEKQYISQAALQRAESDYKTAAAQTRAQLSQSGMANVQSGLHNISAPYAGVVSAVMTEVGDMALPGKPLLSLYDPSALRVVVNVPQSQLATLAKNASNQVLIAAAIAAERKLNVTELTIMPTADPISNMVQLRLNLPQTLSSISPGMFARAQLAVTANGAQAQLYVPASAVIRRSELMAVYVVDSRGRAQLRQVRLGRTQGSSIEVFAGLRAGERVALDPLAAANAH
jgi:RND family efflux transporter MFP subunit